MQKTQFISITDQEGTSHLVNVLSIVQVYRSLASEKFLVMLNVPFGETVICITVTTDEHDRVRSILEGYLY